MSPLLLKYAGPLVVIAALGGAVYLLYTKSYQSGYDAAANIALQADKERIEALNMQLLKARQNAEIQDAKLAEANKKLRKKARVITKEVVKIVKAVEFRCPVPDDGVRILNKARTGPSIADDS